MREKIILWKVMMIGLDLVKKSTEEKLMDFIDE
ncbi:hypothetical protein [Acinetobacter phage Ab69]|nr:hypothetical protein [Acinetobacter phage Ab69]